MLILDSQIANHKLAVVAIEREQVSPPELDTDPSLSPFTTFEHLLAEEGPNPIERKLHLRL